jgi:hypothetical protein
VEPKLASTDSSLHGLAERLGIRASAPAMVAGQISFEISQVSEKPEAGDDPPDRLVEVRPLVSAKKCAS